MAWDDEEWNHSGWQSTESDDMKWQIQNLQDQVQHLGYLLNICFLFILGSS